MRLRPLFRGRTGGGGLAGRRRRRRGDLAFHEDETVLAVELPDVGVLGLVFPVLYPIHLGHEIDGFVDLAGEQPLLVVCIWVRGLFFVRVEEIAITFIAKRMYITILSLPGDKEIDGRTLAIPFYFGDDDGGSEEDDDRGPDKK